MREKGLLVEDSVSKGGTGPHTEEISMDAGGVVVHVIQLRASLVPACDHRAHAQTIAAVLIPGQEIYVALKL